MDLFTPLENELRQRIEQSVPDPKFHYPWALRMYAMTAVEKAHETNYRVIVGSQIFALKMANQNGGKLSDENLRSIYSNALLEHPGEYQGFSYEAWLGFLHRCSYLVVGEGQYSTMFFITDLGRNFLMWMALAGASESKAL
jgi:hypothetical protein